MREVAFKLVELFCVPGGLTFGAKSARIIHKDIEYSVSPIWANDIDEDSCKTYIRNIHPDDPSAVVCKSVEDIDFKKIPSFDVIAFGFPCNDFSLVGEQKGFRGKYGPLYTYGVKAINTHNPKWFFAENVSGIQSANEGMAFSKILEDLEKAGRGYKLTPNLYKFEQYGVPQCRHRIVIIGIRKDLNLEFKVPAPITLSQYISAQKAIE